MGAHATIQRAGAGWTLTLAWWLAAAAGAAPLDLDDPTPRWIEVRFEISPQDEPGALDRRWSPARRAWLEPVSAPPAVAAAPVAAARPATLPATEALPVRTRLAAEQGPAGHATLAAEGAAAAHATLDAEGAAVAHATLVAEGAAAPRATLAAAGEAGGSRMPILDVARKPGSRRALRIRIPAEEVEAQLRSTGTDTVSGSFSDFVWTLDPATGAVLRAALEGEVREEVRLGPLRTRARIAIRVDMATDRAAGFVRESGFLGIPTNRHCRPGGREARCVAVPSTRFDPRRGYVNAVGTLRAASPLAELETFSPLGEVEFREWSGPGQDGTEATPGGTPLEDAICYRAVGAGCPADLGGES